MTDIQKLKKILIWFLTPFLDAQDRPSIRRGLATYFSYSLTQYVKLTPIPQETVVFWYSMLIVGLLGLTTLQGYLKDKFSGDNSNKEEPKEA